jgi:predicted permease
MSLWRLFYVIPLLLRSVFRRTDVEQELDEELRFHVERRTEEAIAKGLSPEEARYLALRTMEGIEQRKEECRDLRRTQFVDQFIQDIRYAWRSLLKSPGFAVVAVLTLALGLGANSAIFSVLHAVVLRALPYTNPADLALVNTAGSRKSRKTGTTYRDYEEWKTHTSEFQDLAAYERDSFTLTSIDEPRFVDAASVSANFFDLLGIPPLIGRVPSDEEFSRQERLVVISEGMCQRHFGGSPAAIGQTLAFSGRTWLIIGVMPKGFQFPDPSTDLWVPITTTDRWNDPREHVLDSPRWSVIGRVKSSVTFAQAQAEMDTFAARVGKTFNVVPLHAAVTGNARLAISVLFGAVTLVSLIACVNVANLILARGAARQHEIALRIAVGASRSRILRQLITENLLLSLLSGSLGVALASTAVRVLIALGPSDIPRLSEAAIDPVVLIWTFALCVLVGIMFGVTPALHHTPSRSSEAPKGRSQRVSAVLAIAELALAMVLLAGAGLLIRSFLALQAINPGFRPDGVLTMNLYVPGSAARGITFEQAVLDRVSALPGVLSAGAVQGLFSLGDTRGGLTLRLEGRPSDPAEQWIPINWTTIAGNYFQTMGIPLLKGRFFTAQDGPDAPLVVLIDESLARHYWPGEDVVGKRLKGTDPRGRHDDWLTVVGLVKDIRDHGRDREPTPHVYQPQSQSLRFAQDLVVRTSNSTPVAATLRGLMRSIEKDAVLSRITTIEQQLGEQVSRRRFQTWLLTLFASVALLLATIGIYGLLHYSVTRRTREIGIRMALGADVTVVVIMVLRQGLILVAAGVTLGIIGSWLLTRVLSSLLFGVTPTDPVTFALVASTLLFVALVACYVPARRAANVNPTIALRCE